MGGLFEHLRGRRAEAAATAAMRHRHRFHAFQELLRGNNEVLELMADMEEKRSGEFLFDRAYLETSVERILPASARIVERLAELTHDRYPELASAHREVAEEVRGALRRSAEIPAEGPWVLPLEHTTGADALLAGGKMAHLGEIRNRVGLEVPDGFTITSTAFLRFVEHNRLRERIRFELAGVRFDDLAEIEQVGARLQALAREAQVPEPVAEAVRIALVRLEHGRPGPAWYAVRSSAVREDGELSFAGQYATFLNVPAREVLERYRDVLASLFTPRAVFYCLTKGFSEEEMVMAVGVIRMVAAESGGVAYSRDPNAPENGAVLVSAVRGLGTQVVDGSGAHDTFLVDRETGAARELRIAHKDRAVTAAAGGGVRERELTPTEREQPTLSDTQLAALARAADALERHYGQPQDIEWAIDDSGRLVVLQSRPLRLTVRGEEPRLPRRFPGYRVLLDRGEVASRGAGCGPVFVLRDETDLAQVPEGAVLVARNTSTRFVAVMRRVAAIVTDVGGTAGHMASLAREYGVPALLDTGTATRDLAPGTEVTVDALHGTVYEGRVSPLLEHVTSKREPLRETPLVRTLGAILQWIAPLHLTDPDSPDFLPERCRTLHDITRFAHEKAMVEMFEAGSARELAEKGTIPLLAGIPVGVHLLDLGGGIRPGAKKAGPADILSVPLAAMLRGLTAMRWPEPPAADVGGFMGMVAHTATIPEEELRRTAEKSFAVVSADYLHFSIRLGYHFSLVEAYVGERLNDNYIRFFFKGGGAVLDRRLRRVRLIAEILRRLDFQVKVVEDIIDAAALKYRREDLEAKLTALGKLTAYTKQLDMAMFNDEVTDWYRDEFFREHLGAP